MSNAQTIQAPIAGEADPNPPSDLGTPEASQPTEITIPDKFKNEDGTTNVEQLAKAHAELESKLGKPTEEGAAVEPIAQGTTPTLELTDETGAGADEAFLADVATWSEEYAKGEGLSDATYAQIQERYNVGREGADRFIAGEQAIAEAGVRRILDQAGGQESFDDMLKWVAKTDGREAASELSAVLMEAMLAGDQARVNRELGGAQARWKEGTRKGWSPELTGRDASGNSIQPFANQSEVDKAQASPEYMSGDAAYHKVFDQRLKLSMDMGVL